MYEEGKGRIKDLKNTYQDKMQVKKDAIIKKKEDFKHQLKEAKDEYNRTVAETKHEFRENFKGAAEEWKAYGGLMSRVVKKRLQRKKRSSSNNEF